MRAGERQVAPDLSGIRGDHRARYEFSARNLPRGSRVLDMACGVGYGAYIMAKAGHRVLAVDNDHEAIGYALEHYAHPRVGYLVRDAMEFRPNLGKRNQPYDAVTCFETIEHLADPRPMLKMFAEVSITLFASVPNEEKFPFKNYAFHHRHYTRAQFQELLAECGWEVTEWWGQEGPESAVRRKVNGRTAIVVAKRAAKKAQRGRKKGVDIHKVIESIGDAIENMPGYVAAADNGALDGKVHHKNDVDIHVHIDYAPKPTKVPGRVAIIGLGPTCHEWLQTARCLGAAAKLVDEVWGINAIGDVLRCDRIFHMDDVRVQEIRAVESPDGNIAAMLTWMRQRRGIPIYTSRPHPHYPDTVAYPIMPVLNEVNGNRYLNGTAAYAVAFAIYIGVKEIQLWGVDFSYENSHKAEKGRACVEFWLGVAAAKGIKIVMPGSTTLMDACVPDKERLYGYDTLELSISGPEGQEVMTFKERQDIPTASEIEHRYDHNRHPNALAEAQQGGA